MQPDKQITEAPSAKEETPQEQPDEFVGITRPIARRMSGVLPSRGGPAAENPAILQNQSSSHTAAAGPDQRASAWTKYSSGPASQSPPHELAQEAAVPPGDTDATLATQAAAQQLWESHAAAESDQTASTTPPPDSPPPPVNAPSTSQPNNLQAILNGLGNLTPQQALQLQELYLKTLKAVSSAAPLSKTPDAATVESNEEKEQAQGLSLPLEITTSQAESEKANANGSLVMLPEPSNPPAAMSAPEAAPALPQLQAKIPPASPFYPPATSGAFPPLLNTAGPQQVIELLGDMLRAQTSGTVPPAQQGILPQEQPALVMNGSGLPPYSSLRYSSQEATGAPGFPQAMDADTYNKLSARRWSSCASMSSDSSLYQAAGSFAPLNTMPSLPQNLSSTEIQALLQAIQQKYQASELENMANLTIQAILTGSATRDANSFPRKRKLPDVFEEQAKRHNSLFSEGEHYQLINGQQQICTECGTTQTPTWRRSGKRLMCNACGLRRSRSMRSARSASMPINPQQSVGVPEQPVEEPAKMPAGV